MFFSQQIIMEYQFRVFQYSVYTYFFEVSLDLHISTWPIFQRHPVTIIQIIIYNTHVESNIYNLNFKKMKIFPIFLCIIILASAQNDQNGQQTQSQISVEAPQQVVMAVGQIMPGQIDVKTSNQKLHFLKLGTIEKKFLFIRISSFDKVRHSIGLYSNDTRQIVFACEDSMFDSCYVPMNKLKENQLYVILIVAMDNIKYNLYSYWADLEHLKPNQQIKFTFNKDDLTQLFHLELEDKTFQQIRILLKPQAGRSQGDNVKMFANLGFDEEPTVQKHDIISSHVWSDAQAIMISKDQLKGKKGVGLYIVGNADTIYTLHCQLVETLYHELKINETINQYLPVSKETYYKIALQEDKGADIYSLKFSVFTGEVSVNFYYDKELTKLFNKQPFQYMSDMQFYLSKKDFEGDTKQIYMKVKSYDSKVTYQVLLQGRQKEIAYEISENVFEFSVINPKDKPVGMYFYAHVWSEAGQYEQLQNYKYDISIINIFGKVTYDYVVCKPESVEEDCKNLGSAQFEKSVSKIQPTGIQQIGTKIIATLDLNVSQFKQINNLEKKILIMIIIRNPADEKAAMAIQYSNPNNVRLLRQGRAFEDKVRTLERKFFKYVNNNPKVNEIRIHVNEISGLIKVRAKRQNIRQAGGNQIKLDKLQPNTIVIKEDLTKPIYLEVFGLVSSIYTVSLSAEHDQHGFSSSLIMAEDIQYDIKLAPYQTSYVQLHPIESSIDFEYYVEGGPVTICQVDNKNKCVDEKVVSSHGKQTIDSSKLRQVRIRLSNFVKSPQEQSNQPEQPQAEFEDDLTKRKTKTKQIAQLVNPVKVTLIYHASGAEHCDERRLNKVYSESVEANKCLKFHLPLATDIEIMASHSEIGLAYETYILCSKKIKPAEVNDRLVVRADTIKQSCQKTPNDMNLVMVIGSKNTGFPAGLKIDYSVEYNNDTVTLADGVAYIARGQSTPEVPQRTFFYQVLDESRDINIVLFNRKGTQRFFADLTIHSERYFGVVTQGKAKFNSKDSDYYTNPYIKVSPNDMKLAQCGKTCVLVVSVYSSEKTGTDIEYALEITQNHIQLREDEIRKDFLPKFSFNFYQYQARKQKGSLYFTISDNNRKCARSILGRNPFPTGSNYLVKQNEGSILYNKTQKGIYYFSVQATEDCPYTVSVSERDEVITRMQYGQFFDIRLEQGEKKWFYTRHISNSSLKLLFMKEFGEIQLYANQTDLSKETLKKIRDKEIDVSQLSFKTSYKNTISINSNSKDFCSSCFYIFCVQATKLTQGELFLGSDNSKLTVGEKRIVFDQLTNLNSSTGASFYRVSSGMIQVKVHSGKIKLEMSYSTQKFSKEYPQDKKVYRQSYNFTREDGKYQPIQISVTPLQVPALYSFEIAPDVDPSSFTHKLNPGQHSYIFLEKSQPQCIIGTLVQKEEEVFITTDSGELYVLNDLKLDVQINEKQTKQYKKEIVGNILSIRFVSESKLVTQFRKFNVCLSTQSRNDTLTIMAFQNNNINLIHSDTEILLRKQGRFALYPKSDVIVDLFQCNGSAEIYYGSDIENIRSQNSRTLDSLGISGQSHAIRIAQTSPLYLDISANMATVLWMPLIEAEQRGVGYFKYFIGKLEYKSKFNNLEFIIGGVYKGKETKTVVKNIIYTLYVTNSKESLQSAVMCEKSEDSKFVKASIRTQEYGKNPDFQISLSLQKKRITDQFSENQTLYFNVVADMTLQPPGQLQPGYHEHYRFVYFEQLVPSQVFRQNKVQSMQLTLLIVLAVVSIIGFILIACVFIKCIVPAIGKLRNRVLVEQDNKDESMPVPQSSERNKNDIPTATDEQLK